MWFSDPVIDCTTRVTPTCSVDFQVAGGSGSYVAVIHRQRSSKDDARGDALANPVYAAGSGPPNGDQPCNGKKLGVAAAKLRNQAGPGSSEFLT